MDSSFPMRAVRSAKRRLVPRPAAPACPACGRPIADDEGLPLQGARYHRGCALYSPRRSLR